jgi:hypothetical protein
MVSTMVVGDERGRRMRGDALLLAHCRLLGTPAAPAPRDRLRREVGDRFAGILVAALVPQAGRRGSSSP